MLIRDVRDRTVERFRPGSDKIVSGSYGYRNPSSGLTRKALERGGWTMSEAENGERPSMPWRSGCRG